MAIIIVANLVLMWHSVIWQIDYRMYQEVKVYEAIIHKSTAAIQKQRDEVKEQKKLTVSLQVIDEISFSDDEAINSEAINSNTSHGPGLSALKELIAMDDTVVERSRKPILEFLLNFCHLEL